MSGDVQVRFCEGLRVKLPRPTHPTLHEGLDPNEFAGGSQSNKALEALGFAIVECKCGGLRDTVRKVSHIQDAPRLARIVVNGRAAFAQENAIKCLRDVARAMRQKGAKFDVITTPGGFIKAQIAMKAQPIGWEAPATAFRAVSANAEKTLAPLLHSLRDIDLSADFLTLGVDVFLPGNLEEYANAQLVATVDLSAMKIAAWTGKSYPTLAEEKELVHERDLRSHLQKIGRWRCLILGCHDLNMFSPRSMATRDANSARGQRADQLIRLAEAFDPQSIHTIPTRRTSGWEAGRA